jgi:hypothetical protein
MVGTIAWFMPPSVFLIEEPSASHCEIV